MVVVYHLCGRLGMECGCRWSGVGRAFLAQSSRESQNPESPYKRVKIPSCASAGLLFCRYWHLLAMSGVPKEEAIARICLQLATSFAHTHGNSMV